LSSYSLGVDAVVLGMRTNEADVNDAIGVIDPRNDTVLVACDIEHHATVCQSSFASPYD